ncbi:alpha/beta hydrolase [Paraliomyxa miuraensis]|uniref:alpha/beta hydrolase n=1 Tax=Paraliomyxa miuraensis TaxID=376150 RepID=UPI0022561D0A|nr:alpha/beta fold hydrolase [Paraliomyxa miuraensis]MCX4246119.1 lysophospholipase [Paraliomyxa miuraensis]
MLLTARSSRRLPAVTLALALLGACVPKDPAPAPAIPPAAAATEAEHTAASPPAQLAPPLTRSQVDVEGHPITVWSKHAERPWGVVVLVHGRTWSARPDFDLRVEGIDTVPTRSLMDMLVAEGLTVYAIDQRGYGDTPRDDTGWLTTERAVADLAAVLQWVRSKHPGQPPPALLGWSLGSLISQLTAQQHPDLLSTLILYGYPRRPGQEYPPDPVPLPPPAMAATTAEAAAEDFIIPGSISQAGIDAFVKAALAADPVRMDWRANEQWAALDPTAVHTPTLVIHGERDPYAPVANQAELFSLLGTPDRAWVIVANGDHAAHLEDNGSRFVHAVVQFLRRPR